MKLTAKITSIIALLLTLTMVLTGCSALQDILDQILGGTDDPPVNDDPSGYTISAENQDGVLYFSGSVTDGRFDGVYRDTFATLVNLTEVDGGYIIHFVDNAEVTQYIVINDMAAGAALTTDKFEATIFEWNADLETYVVADDSNNRAFGVGKTSTFTTFSCYDVSNTNYNYGKFTPVNNPTIEKGEGGKPTGGNGGNGGNGGSTGGNGGSTDNFGVIDTPVVGTAYKFGMVQGNLDNTIYYLAGGMDGYYMATTVDVAEAIDVYLEETNGGYHLYCMVGGAKTYINFVVSGEHVNGAYEATASTVYRYDAESKTLIAEVDGADYWLATRNDKTYTTMGPCKTSYNGFYGQFYGVGGTTGGNQGGNEGGNQGGNEGGNQGGNTDSFGVIDTPVVGTAYKFGMVQGNLDNAIYYLAGGMDGYYMATTTDVNDAIDVYLEETNGGYHLYCMVGGAKTYINFVVSGEHVNGAYEATASTVYRYDAESKTLIAEVDGADYWLATRNDKTYTTMGPCKTSYNGFYGQFYGVGGTTGGNQGGNEGGNQGGNEGGNQGGNTDSFGVIDTPVVGTAYKFGMVQGNLDNAIYYLAGGMDGYYMATTTDVNDAIDVYLEETNGGYHLYCMVGGAKTYINFVVSGEHVNGAYEATASTVYRYDAESKTLIAEVDGADYWLATRNDKTYTTMGPCKTSYEGFYGQFYGVGGISGGNQGGNEGGNQGGNEGGNEGGNQGGNTGTNNPFEGGFELGLVPAYDASYGGYYIINNNTPYFTAEEIADAKAECFEYYAARDNLGRAIMAFACVCNNTRPTDSRGDISSVKPTGWVQKTYDNVPGGALYNRSHLIAWSLTDEDANWENLVTGTEHMNQKVMTQFENQILDYIKANNSNKVLYRVTPIYNGNNLVCTGILLEAYSLNDNGDDISFCVFVYNVQPGISINYANGQSQKGDEAGQNSGLAGSIVDDGNQGSGTVTLTPVGKYTISANNADSTLYFKGSVTGGRFDCSTNKADAVEVTVYQVDGGFVLGFMMGGAEQYIVMEDSSSGGKLTINASEATVFEWNADLSTYMVAEDSNSRAFGAGVSSTYTNLSPYDASSSANEGKYNWGVFTPVDGSSTPGQGGGTTTPAHTCESVCDECGKCTDAACNEAACANKCEGHETVDPGTGDAVELETYSHTMAKQDFTANGTATLSGLEWTLAGDGGYWGWDNNNVKGIQLGSANAPYKTMTLTSAPVSNVKKIVISTCGASNIAGTLTVTVNGVQVGDTIKLTKTNTEYTFELDEATTGEIVFTYTQTSSKAFYINTISIYTEK